MTDTVADPTVAPDPFERESDGDVEHLDVLVIGAGLSGIGAGWYLNDHCPWASYAIFEARGAIGGTWDLFRYPGIRSDSDMYTLGYSFRPWTGEKAIADGADILQYIRDTATEGGIDDKIRFHHRIVAADWSTDEARWHVTAERTDTGEPVRVTADFVFSCSGYYRYDHGYEPDFPGIEDFGGQVVHPQHWPEDLDYADKKIVVIGSGATAITLIPSLAATGAGHVTMLQRSPTYIVAVPGRSPIARLVKKLPQRWSGPMMKWIMALGTQGMYQFSRKRPETMKKILRKQVERQLPDGYSVDPHFTPTYNPWDQRLCVVPDGDLFKAIRKGTASVVTGHIDRFDETGITLVDGTHVDADIVVTATGLEVLFLGGMDLSVDGEKVDLSERLTYKGMMIENVPNLAIAIGYTNASWTLKCDLTCGYVTRMLNHMRATGLRQATPVNVGGAASPSPLLGLESGYLTRAADRLPKQGSVAPWKVHQSYLRDYRALKKADLVDEAMQFTNGAPARSRSTSSV